MVVFTYLMMVYSNTLFYTMALMGIVISLVGKLYFMNLLSTLMSLLSIAVYVGAVMIMIGYVCAICPNEFSTKFTTNKLGLFMVFLLLVYFSVGAVEPQVSQENMTGPFLFNTMGMIFFLLLVVLLMLTLLVSTSLLVSPKGPFREIL